MAIYFTPEDIDFIRKIGYDDVRYERTLKDICTLDKILEDELHISDSDDVAPYYLAMLLGENPRYAEAFIEVAAGYERIASQGNLLAKSRLARMYSFSNDKLLLETALEYAKESAEAGHAQAQFILGTLTASAHWLMKSADAGDPYAICELGCWYYEGKNGLIKNTEKAMMLWKKSNLSKGAYNRISCSEFLDNHSNDSVIEIAYGLVHDHTYYYRGFNTLLGDLYNEKNDHINAYEWYKRAVDYGELCASEIVKFYKKYPSWGRRSDVEPLSYWEEKNEMLMCACIEYNTARQDIIDSHRPVTSSAPSACSAIPSPPAADSSISPSPSSAENTKGVDWFKIIRWIVVLYIIFRIIEAIFLSKQMNNL